jgi:hypothetical protein
MVSSTKRPIGIKLRKGAGSNPPLTNITPTLDCKLRRLKMAKKYFGRTTEVKLADGEMYKFAALPWTAKTEKLVEAFSNDNKNLTALREAIVYSLSFNYENEQIEELFETGCIPLGDDGTVLNDVMGALFMQGSSANPKNVTV